LSGIVAAPSSSIAAPVCERLRMMQSISEGTPEVIAPPLKVRRRGEPRLSIDGIHTSWRLPARKSNRIEIATGELTKQKKLPPKAYW